MRIISSGGIPQSVPVVLFLAILLIIGCSAGYQTTHPDEPAAGREYTGSHQCWGLWTFIADQANKTLEAVPLRAGGMHINALPFLEPPPLTNLTLESLEFNGDIIEADIGLRHPFLGFTEFTGFDVCGILISRGSKDGYTDSSLLFPGDADTRLLNPDGFSRWWNPAEFPVNLGTMFSYNDGFLGTPHKVGNFTATVNGYKYFADTLDPDDDISSLPLTSRGQFSAGQQNVRHYTIQLGSEGLIFNYAIDACWQFPTGSWPWETPDDFGEGANRSEAYRISITEVENTLWNDGEGSGGDLSLLIQAYDWFNAGNNSLRVESPGTFPAVDVTSPDSSDDNSATFTVSVTGATPPEVESIELLITSASEETGYGGLVPGASVSAYFFTSVAVDDEDLSNRRNIHGLCSTRIMVARAVSTMSLGQ